MRVSSAHRVNSPSRLLAFLIAAALGCTLQTTSASAAARSSDLIDGQSALSRNISTAALPDATMKAGLLSDSEGRIIWSRNADVRRPMASITKIMTAIVALENSKLTDVVTVPPAAASVGQSTAYLESGERLTMKELLTAMLVQSGNDAATAIAMHVAGTEDRFVDMMNAKARTLGLVNTHFRNPHGLDAKGHYSTARELSVMARYAMANPSFASIVRLKKATIGSGAHKHKLESTDLLLGNYDGAIGVKTGNTDGAGYSVVSAAVRSGVMLYAVVLGTVSDSQRFRDAKELLDWGFAHYRPQNLATAGTVVGQAPVVDYLDVLVPAAISRDATAAVLDLNGSIRRTVTIAPVKAPIKAGDKVGVVTYSQGSSLIAGMPLVATSDVDRPNILLATWIALVRGWRAVFGTLVFA